MQLGGDLGPRGGYVLPKDDENPARLDAVPLGCRKRHTSGSS